MRHDPDRSSVLQHLTDVILARVGRALPALLLFAVGACRQEGAGRGDSAVAAIPGNEAREISIEVDRARPSMSRREWTSSHGDTTDTMVGFFAGDTPRLVREQVARGERERSSNRYYYAAGALRYYESDGERSRADSTQPPAKEKVRTSLAFDASGSLVEGSHQVDGQTEAIDSVEVRLVLERAAALREQAASAPAAPRPARPTSN